MKPFWQSKTLWVNTLAVGVYVGKSYLGVEQLPELNPATLAIVNLLLRLLTNRTVTL